MDLTKTVVILGKGPSLPSKVKVDDSMVYCALNGAISVCEGIVDFHFMNDADSLDLIPIRDLSRAKNIVIPSYPHVLIDGRKTSSADYTYRDFIASYPKELRDRFTVFEMPTAKVHNPNLPFYNVRLTVASSAVHHMLALGYRNFRFIGVGDGIDVYSSAFKDETFPKNGFSKRVRALIEDLMIRNNCIYSFASDHSYKVVNTNETFYLPQYSDNRFKDIPMPSKVETEESLNLRRQIYHNCLHNLPCPDCHSVPVVDFKAVFNSRLGNTRDGMSFTERLNARRGVIK